MRTTLNQVSLEDARHYLDQLDLQYLIDAMCAPQYPLPRWTPEAAMACVALYKQFLWLQKKHFPSSLVPTREIDECWHNHILHTKQYLHDCMQIFGFYLHHQPLLPNEDTQQLRDDFLKTKQLYLEEFNQPLTLLRA